MIQQVEFTLNRKPRGFSIITDEVLFYLPELPNTGMLHLFIKHTSAGLTINENADPDVLEDMELYFNQLVKENLPGMKHTCEGPDDMPAHVKSTLAGASIQIPISKGKLNLGTWQGIYLCEFRNYGTARKIVATIYS